MKTIKEWFLPILLVLTVAVIAWPRQGMTVAVAGVSKTLNSSNSLTTNNPPIPDPLIGASVAAGIVATQYPECGFCSAANYQVVAGCPNVIGTPQECQGFCHVPDGFDELRSSDPPNSGNHYPDPWATLGVMPQPVPRGRYIHSMEHGAVIFVYNCANDPTNCNNNLSIMEQVVQNQMEQNQLVIMTADLNMTSTPYAVISWAWLYKFTSADANTLNCFVQQHTLFGRECNDKVCVALTNGPMVSVTSH